MENNTLALRFIIDNQLKTYWVDPNHSSRDGEKTRHLLQNLPLLILSWPVKNIKEHVYTNSIIESYQTILTIPYEMYSYMYKMSGNNRMSTSRVFWVKIFLFAIISLSKRHRCRDSWVMLKKLYLKNSGNRVEIKL